MRILRLSKIKNNRVFRNFVWSSGDLWDFVQFNVIYGWNGSGKTTISSLFENLQDKERVSTGEVKFVLDNQTTISGDNISPDATIPQVRVFNRNFAAETVESFGAGNIQPIYYLGKKSVEKQKYVTRLKKVLNKVEERLIEIDNQSKEATKEFERYCTDIAKKIKDALLGSANHTNYDKRQFKEKLRQLKGSSPLHTPLSDEEKGKLVEQKNSQAKDNISNIKVPEFNLVELRSRVSSLLKKSIVTQVLDELKDDSAIASWVQQGLKLHTEKYKSDTCRFCGSEFSTARREKLEGHFNDAFASFQREIKEMVSELANHRRSVKSIKEITLPDSRLFYEQIRQEANVSLKLFKSAADSVIEIFDYFKNTLDNKKNNPFQVQSLESAGLSETEVHRGFQDALTAVNSVISSHNQTTIDMDNLKNQACKELEQNYVLEAIPKFNDLGAVVANTTSLYETMQNRQSRLTNRIKQIEDEIIEHRRPAEELSAELCAYLGRDELKFEVTGTGYSLTRGEEPAEHLSEGERTAIAFLYFLKSLEDKDFDMATGIVVIDDPVSSLDANALFSAFDYMKERTKNCNQLFILTHNFAFLRQVKNWLHHLKKRKRKSTENGSFHFYLLKTKLSNNQRNASICPMDGLLEEFDSEYHYLFKQIYEVANSDSEDENLEQFYGVPNIARRLIETFLAYRFPDCSGSIRECFKRIKNFDSSKKNKIINLLHTYSHSSGITDPEHDPSILSETKQVMTDILNLIETLDKNHYDGMLALLHQQDKED